MSGQLKKVKAESITHIGIAVSDLEKAIKDYTSLFEFESVQREELQTEGVKIAILRAQNDSEIELLAPTNEDSPVAKFIREKGEGVHHLAVRVPDVSDAIKNAKEMGLRVLDEKPRIGSRNAEAAFVHPKSFHGVLLEFYSH